MLSRAIRRVFASSSSLTPFSSSLTSSTTSITPAASVGVKTISASFASPINEGYSGETYERKESAQERAFINKQEQAILKNLVKKYESQIDPHGVDENNKLEFIFHKHKTPLSKELREDLKAWKHS